MNQLQREESRRQREIEGEVALVPIPKTLRPFFPLFAEMFDGLFGIHGRHEAVV